MAEADRPMLTAPEATDSQTWGRDVLIRATADPEAPTRMAAMEAVHRISRPKAMVEVRVLLAVLTGDRHPDPDSTGLGLHHGRDLTDTVMLNSTIPVPITQRG